MITMMKIFRSAKSAGISLVGWPKGRLVRGKFRVNTHGIAKSARKPGNFLPKIAHQKKQPDIIPAHLDSLNILQSSEIGNGNLHKKLS